jgi:hypothetical protein
MAGGGYCLLLSSHPSGNYPRKAADFIDECTEGSHKFHELHGFASLVSGPFFACRGRFFSGLTDDFTEKSHRFYRLRGLASLVREASIACVNAFFSTLTDDIVYEKVAVPAGNGQRIGTNIQARRANS